MTKLTIAEQLLHNEFSRYGKNAKEWHRKCAILLPRIEREEIWKKKRFKSIYHYTAVVAGMSYHQAREALRVIKKIEDKPDLMNLVEKKGINAVSAIATIATKETAGFWAAKTEALSVNGLKMYVRETRKSKNVLTLQSGKLQKTVMSLTLPEALATRLDRASKRDDFEELMNRFLDEIEEKANATKPKPVETTSRHIPAEINRYVTTRTGNQCAYPNCNKAVYQRHHTQRFSLQQVHDPDRLHLMCKEHNELAHNGLIENEEGASIIWKMREEPDCTNRKYKIDQKMLEYTRLT